MRLGLREDRELIWARLARRIHFRLLLVDVLDQLIFVEG